MTNSEIKSVCLYCGSSPGANPAFVAAASELGACLAKAGLGLIYGGGDRGLMGAAARGALAQGGKVTGIIPKFLLNLEQERGGDGLEIAEMIVVPDMHTRKHMMFEKADAFIALPGGIGTLEELVEIMTWAQLGRHAKPMGLLNTDGFWTPLTDLIEHMTNQGFLHSPERTRLLIDDNPQGILNKILA